MHNRFQVLADKEGDTASRYTSHKETGTLDSVFHMAKHMATDGNGTKSKVLLRKENAVSNTSLPDISNRNGKNGKLLVSSNATPTKYDIAILSMAKNRELIKKARLIPKNKNFSFRIKVLLDLFQFHPC